MATVAGDDARRALRPRQSGVVPSSDKAAKEQDLPGAKTQHGAGTEATATSGKTGANNGKKMSANKADGSKATDKKATAHGTAVGAGPVGSRPEGSAGASDAKGAKGGKSASKAGEEVVPFEQGAAGAVNAGEQGDQEEYQGVRRKGKKYEAYYHPQRGNQLYLGIYKTAKEAAEWADKAYWLMNRDNLQGNLNFPELASTYNEQEVRAWYMGLINRKAPKQIIKNQKSKAWEIATQPRNNLQPETLKSLAVVHGELPAFSNALLNLGNNKDALAIVQAALRGLLARVANPRVPDPTNQTSPVRQGLKQAPTRPTTNDTDEPVATGPAPHTSTSPVRRALPKAPTHAKARTNPPHATKPKSDTAPRDAEDNPALSPASPYDGPAPATDPDTHTDVPSESPSPATHEDPSAHDDQDDDWLSVGDLEDIVDPSPSGRSTHTDQAPQEESSSVNYDEPLNDPRFLSACFDTLLSDLSGDWVLANQVKDEYEKAAAGGANAEEQAYHFYRNVVAKAEQHDFIPEFVASAIFDVPSVDFPPLPTPDALQGILESGETNATAIADTAAACEDLFQRMVTKVTEAHNQPTLVEAVCVLDSMWDMLLSELRKTHGMQPGVQQLCADIAEERVDCGWTEQEEVDLRDRIFALCIRHRKLTVTQAVDLQLCVL